MCRGVGTGASEGPGWRHRPRCSFLTVCITPALWDTIYPSAKGPPCSLLWKYPRSTSPVPLSSPPPVLRVMEALWDWFFCSQPFWCPPPISPSVSLTWCFYCMDSNGRVDGREVDGWMLLAVIHWFHDSHTVSWIVARASPGSMEFSSWSHLWTRMPHERSLSV